MKKTLTIIFIIFAFLSLYSKASALGSLPKYELPKVHDLEKPKLSKNYEDMKNSMDSEYKDIMGKKPDIHFDEAKNAINTQKAKSAYDIFKQKNGDLWNTTKKKYSKTIEPPSQKMFDSYLSTLSKDTHTKLEAKKALDTQQMNVLLTKALDTSKMWDLDEIKKSTHFMSSSQIDEYLNSAVKPAGWEDIKKQAYADKKSALDEIPVLSSISDGIKEVKDLFKSFFGIDIPTPGETKVPETDIQGILDGIDDNSSISDSQLKKLKEGALNQTKSFFDIFKN